MNVSQYNKQLTPQQAIQFEIDLFSDLEKGTKDPQAELLSLFNYFSELHFQRERMLPHVTTYWSWYIRMYWLYIHRLDHQFVSQTLWSVVFGGVSMAFPVLDVYLQYLANLYKRVSDDDLRRVHNIGADYIKKGTLLASFESSSPLVLSEVCALVQEDFSHFSAIQKAEYFSKIEYQLFEKNSLASGFSSEERMQNVSNLILFLQLFVRVDNIIPIIKSYIRLRDARPIKEGQEIIPFLSVLVEIATDNDPSLAPPDTTFLVEDVNLFTYLKKVYHVDSVGALSYTDIIFRLDIMAVLYNDSRIRDVYYYNEATGEFEWDESLLKELKLIPPDFDMSTIAK